MMRLLWTPEAIADRDAIYDYIEPDNPRAALALDGGIAESGRKEGVAWKVRQTTLRTNSQGTLRRRGYPAAD